MVGGAGGDVVAALGRGISVTLSEIAGARGARRNARAALSELNRQRLERDVVAAWFAEREQVTRSAPQPTSVRV